MQRHVVSGFPPSRNATGGHRSFSGGGSRTIAALVACSAVTLLTAQTADRARTEALARRAGERLVALQREADRLASEESTLLNQLRKLEVERQLRAEELKRADADV